MSTVQLPDTDRDEMLLKLLSERRSVRGFRPKELEPEQVGSLLWACQGLKPDQRRMAPSAGALYPLEIFWLDRQRCAHYLPFSHQLELIMHGDHRAGLARAALSQAFIAEAPGTMIITAVYARVTGKYGKPRGTRYVDMEAGHAAQNVLLQATAMGLGSVPVGAFEDDRISELLKLTPDHTPLYLIPIGYT